MNERPLRIVVFGYHTIGYRCLKELLDRGEEICAVVTHQDDPHEHVWFESVVELAQAAGVPVLSPNTPNTPAIVSHITTLQPDLILSFYYRRLLCQALLAIPRLGAINLHGSLLPKYRGRAPVNWVSGQRRDTHRSHPALHDRSRPMLAISSRSVWCPLPSRIRR